MSGAPSNFWTTGSPDAPGFYYRRWVETKDWHIAEVFDESGDLMCCVEGDWYPVDDESCEWGPAVPAPPA